MKHIKLFNTHAEYEIFAESDKYIEPHVSWVEDINKVNYNLLQPKDKKIAYFSINEEKIMSFSHDWIQQKDGSYAIYFPLLFGDDSWIEYDDEGNPQEVIEPSIFKKWYCDNPRVQEYNIEMGWFETPDDFDWENPDNFDEFGNPKYELCTWVSDGNSTFYGIKATEEEFSQLVNDEVPESLLGDYAVEFEFKDDVTTFNESMSDRVLTALSDNALEGIIIIGTGAFAHFYSLTSITIPDSVTSIGELAFYACSGLTSIIIPDSVTSIDDQAFEDCSSLTGVTIPGSVTSIGYRAFNACSSLTSIIVDENNPVYDSRNNCNAIIETETNTLIQGCQNTIIPDSVTSIGDWAFYNCSGLTSIIIPDSVTSIGIWGFRDCTSLTSITIGNSVTSIGTYAFLGCTGLTSVIIGNSVTEIGNSVFSECSGLTSVTIPNSVTSIGEWAFEYCSSLTSITYTGTQSQWSRITKGFKWKSGVPSTCMVHCTDGDIAI